jgi:hypothetical protein
MYRRRVTLGLLSLLGLSFVSACKQPDSILLIDVSGPTNIMAVQFYVTVTVDTYHTTEAFYVPATPMPSDHTIVLPASFTIELAPSHSGPIAITIEALDVTKSPLGSGSTMQQHIELGGQTIIAVALTDAIPPGGADGGSDAGDADTAGSGAAGTQGIADSGPVSDVATDQIADSEDGRIASDH